MSLFKYQSSGFFTLVMVFFMMLKKHKQHVYICPHTLPVDQSLSERNQPHAEVKWARWSPWWRLRWRIMQTEWSQPRGQTEACINIHEFTLQGLFPLCLLVCVCVCVHVCVLLLHSVIHTHLPTSRGYSARSFPFSPQVSPLRFSLICTSHVLITINVLHRFTPWNLCVCVCLFQPSPKHKYCKYSFIFSLGFKHLFSLSLTFSPSAAGIHQTRYDASFVFLFFF